MNVEPPKGGRLHITAHEPRLLSARLGPRDHSTVLVESIYEHQGCGSVLLFADPGPAVFLSADPDLL